MEANWNSPGRIASSQRWEHESACMGREVTQAAVDAALAAPGLRILDLACGSGAPSLPLAKLVVPGGCVVGLDLSQEPLKVALRRARQRGLDHILYLRGHAQQLPFADALFDRVTCRYGAMFFADTVAAFREARRVLRPAGRIALVVWGRFAQPYFDATAAIVMRHTGAALPASARKMFRFGEPDDLAAALREAGFANASAERRFADWTWPGRPEDVWEYFQEVSVPMHPLLQAIRPEQRAAVDREAIAALSRYFDGHHVAMKAEIVVATAEKA